MSRGTWLALCRRDRMLPLSELASRLDRMGNTRATLDGEVLVLTIDDALTGNEAEILVTANHAPHVALESAEIAEAFAANHPRRADIAAADGRYELSWDLRSSDETYNPLLVASGSLRTLCGAILFDPWDATFPFDG